jgi:hypothetical protein
LQRAKDLRIFDEVCIVDDDDRMPPGGRPVAQPLFELPQRDVEVIATLADLAEAVASAELKSPVTTIVGDVVTLSSELDWFNQDDRNEGYDNYDSFNLARA